MDKDVSEEPAASIPVDRHRTVYSVVTASSRIIICIFTDGRLRLKRDGTRTETRFRLSPKRTSPFTYIGVGVSSVDYWEPRCAHQR